MTENKKLIEIAKRAMENAYAPYSNFKVGAALLTADGTIYTGCNIENNTYGSTICEERPTIIKSKSESKHNLIKLAIFSSSEEKTFPCGICRQVIEEFMPEGEVIVSDNNTTEVYKTEELLPHSFHNKF